MTVGLCMALTTALRLYFRTTRVHPTKCNINPWFSTRALKNAYIENNNNPVCNEKSISEHRRQLHCCSIFDEWFIFMCLVYFCNLKINYSINY